MIMAVSCCVFPSERSLSILSAISLKLSPNLTFVNSNFSEEKSFDFSAFAVIVIFAL